MSSAPVRDQTPEVVVRNPQRFRQLESRSIRAWLQRLLPAVAPEVDSFGVCFVGDGEMRVLNRRYRHTDSCTDVLSFPGHRSAEGNHLGDVVIAIPMARRQAAENGLSLRREIRSLLLHGILHCLGYDHETDQGEMLRLEAQLRERWLESNE